MRILFILNLPPPIHGAALMGKIIKESVKINATFKCKYIKLSLSNGINEVGKKVLKKIPRYLNIYLQVIHSLLSYKTQIVYITLNAKGWGFYKDIPLVLLIKCWPKAKIVYHFHNKGVNEQSERLLDHLLYKLVFKNSSAILLSKHLYPDVQKYFPIQNVNYCANGIPDEAGNYVRLLKNAGKTPHILFLSNYLETKGIYVLLEALKLLEDAKLTFECTFAGNEADITRADIEAVVSQLKLKSKINILGAKYGEQKTKLLTDADIFVLPSYDECFSLVILEAMQFSLPVVSTFEGAIPEIIDEGNTGLLALKYSASSLATQIETLIKNPKLRIQMGEAGRLKYEKHYTITHFEDKLLSILNKLSKF